MPFKPVRIERIAANVTVLTAGDMELLFSYDMPVAGYRRDVGYFSTDRFYSATTSGHINKWLGNNGTTRPEAVSMPQEWIDAILTTVSTA